MRAQIRVAILLMILVIAGCAGPSRRAPPSETSPELPVTPMPPPDPLRDEAARRVERACVRTVNTGVTAAACACVARNHRHRLPAAELQLLARKYEAAPRSLAPKSPEQAHLFEYDVGVARECAKNPAYQVPEEP